MPSEDASNRESGENVIASNHLDLSPESFQRRITAPVFASHNAIRGDEALPRPTKMQAAKPAIGEIVS